MTEAFYADPVRHYMIPVFSDRRTDWPSHPHATRDSLHAHDMWVAEGLTHLQVPTLFAWGPRDITFSDRFLRDLIQRVPHADVHRFEGASHLVWEDADVAGVESGRVIARPPSGRSRRPRGHARG